MDRAFFLQVYFLFLKNTLSYHPYLDRSTRQWTLSDTDTNLTDKAFEAYIKEIGENEMKDTLISKLKDQLLGFTSRLDKLSKEVTAEKMSKTMEDFRKEILADKETLRLAQWEVGKLEAKTLGENSQKVMIEQYDKEEEEVEKKEKAEPETKPDDSQLEEAGAKEAFSDAQDEKSPKPTIQDSIVKDLEAQLEKATAENKSLTERLLELQDLHKAKGKANTVLNKKFQAAHSKLKNHKFVIEQNKNLVNEVSWLKDALVNTKQERDYLRNHVEVATSNVKRLSTLLAEKNRKESRHRSDETKQLRSTILKQVEHFKKIAQEKKALEEKLYDSNKSAIQFFMDLEEMEEEMEEKEKMYYLKYQQLKSKYHQLLQALQGAPTDSDLRADGDFVVISEPATPKTPNRPMTPETPKTPIEEVSPVRAPKRRSNDNGTDNKMRRKY